MFQGRVRENGVCRTSVGRSSASEATLTVVYFKEEQPAGEKIY